MINIICKGIWPIPDETKDCPVCGHYTENFILERKRYANPTMGQCCIATNFDFAQMYPTFCCDVCHTVWQYLGEEENNDE